MFSQVTFHDNGFFLRVNVYAMDDLSSGGTTILNAKQQTLSGELELRQIRAIIRPFTVTQGPDLPSQEDKTWEKAGTKTSERKTAAGTDSSGSVRSLWAGCSLPRQTEDAVQGSGLYDRCGSESGFLFLPQNGPQPDYPRVQPRSGCFGERRGRQTRTWRGSCPVRTQGA